MPRKYGPKATAKIGRVMHEFREGTLRSGSGRRVTSRAQAVAIGLSQARRSGYKVPPLTHATKRRGSRRVIPYRGYRITEEGSGHFTISGPETSSMWTSSLDEAMAAIDEMGSAPRFHATMKGAGTYSETYGPTSQRPGYGEKAWQSGYKHAKELAQHETFAQMRESQRQLLDGARNDLEHGMLAAYSEMLGDTPPRRAHARKARR